MPDRSLGLFGPTLRRPPLRLTFHALRLRRRRCGAARELFLDGRNDARTQQVALDEGFQRALRILPRWIREVAAHLLESLGCQVQSLAGILLRGHRADLLGKLPECLRHGAAATSRPPSASSAASRSAA